MWPIEGDYDMNDLSIAFSVTEVKDNQQQVKDIIFTGSVQSYGADYTNGFALLLKTPVSNILTAQMSINGGTKFDINISQDNDSSIIKIFEDAGEYLSPFANAYKDIGFVQSDTFEVSITLNSAAKLSAPPYNPFMIVSRYISDNNNSYTFMDNIEVHLPNYAPSSFAPSALFATLDDTSDIASGRTYKTGDDKPQAFLIPSSFPHPVEKTNIADAYHHYLDWVDSAGQTNADWYIYNKSNNLNQPYSDESKIIIHP